MFKTDAMGLQPHAQGISLSLSPLTLWDRGPSRGCGGWVTKRVRDGGVAAVLGR